MTQRFDAFVSAVLICLGVYIIVDSMYWIGYYQGVKDKAARIDSIRKNLSKDGAVLILRTPKHDEGEKP